MRIGDNQTVHRVGLARAHARDAATAAQLRPVGLQWQALDVAALAQRDHDLLMSDQVFFAVLLRYLSDDLRPSVVAILLL